MTALDPNVAFVEAGTLSAQDAFLWLRLEHFSKDEVSILDL